MSDPTGIPKNRDHALGIWAHELKDSARARRNQVGDPKTTHSEAVAKDPVTDHRASDSQASGPGIDVVIVNSRSIMREGLCVLLDGQPDLRVVGQAETIASAESLAVHPHVTVTDVDLPDARDDRVIERLRAIFPESSILVLTLVDDLAKVRSVLAAGADGYLVETAEVSDLFLGIRTVAGRETYLQPSMAVALARWHAGHALVNSLAGSLTHREQQVLRLIALGHTNTEIAGHLDVSLRTIESDRAFIREKAGSQKRAELVRYAREVGLLDGGEFRQDTDPI
jgi:two-component system response regulator NreC